MHEPPLVFYNCIRFICLGLRLQTVQIVFCFTNEGPRLRNYPVNSATPSVFYSYTYLAHGIVLLKIVSRLRYIQFLIMLGTS